MANSLTLILADRRGNTVYQKRLKHAVFWLPKDDPLILLQYEVKKQQA